MSDVIFTGTYSLDQMSDEDDDGEGPSALRRPTQPITTSQLAAALAVAGGGPLSSMVGLPGKIMQNR